MYTYLYRYIYIYIFFQSYKNTILVLTLRFILYYCILFNIGKPEEMETHNSLRTQKQLISFKSTRTRKSHHVTFVPKCLEVS